VSLTGHAADWGDVTLSVGVDWVHAVAASAWTGGLIALAFVAGRRAAPWSRESLAAVAPRFSRLAGFCLLAIVVTGGYNAWAQLGGLSRLWNTAYGLVLIVKLLIVAVLVWLGAVNRYAHLPRLAPAQAARGVGARAFRMSRLALFGPSRGVRRCRRSPQSCLRHDRSVVGRRVRGTAVRAKSRRGVTSSSSAADDGGACRAARGRTRRAPDAAARTPHTDARSPGRMRDLSRSPTGVLGADNQGRLDRGRHPGEIDHEPERADPRRADTRMSRAVDDADYRDRMTAGADRPGHPRLRSARAPAAPAAPDTGAARATDAHTVSQARA
jgi:uncharacterized membrane protein